MTDAFALNEDQLSIQAAAARFTASAITPNAARWDEEHHFPREVMSAAGEMGFGAIYVREESRGIGLGRLEAALVIEALAYGCPATAAFVSIHNMAAWMIDRFGNDALRARYLPELVGMNKLASYCLTEPGLSFGTPERKLGWNASPTAQVILEDVRVPVENRLGEEGDGFKIAMAGIDGGRVNIGAASLGGAQRCIDEAVQYTKDRKQFGKAIADFQNTQFVLADMATELEAARALLYTAAAKVSAGAPDKTAFAAMAKRFATDTGSSVVDRALQMFGGYGYLRDYPIERFWRDLRVHRILEGTNEIMRLIIARDLLK
ncbi:alkylation response protein AidB-like acyl-CoA dehydrogenase [Novosphingobium sp. SG751A]|uniref:acyl-CoA dehydrogenase family protein n=1 Tax=Novosphingobium sp. SG751A TaxID=2587000 RepID=UPI0015582946|nr:acyl-CoA dehydrogenase family protein [Novosphingobium sp. SG751A]NOW47356.1 alkylation response protein AidB-like acyl-CoA dehydrogenase [Novosphingobium sp. SG751A]